MLKKVSLMLVAFSLALPLSANAQNQRVYSLKAYQKINREGQHNIVSIDSLRSPSGTEFSMAIPKARGGKFYIIAETKPGHGNNLINLQMRGASELKINGRKFNPDPTREVTAAVPVYKNEYSTAPTLDLVNGKNQNSNMIGMRQVPGCFGVTGYSKVQLRGKFRP